MPHNYYYSITYTLPFPVKFSDEVMAKVTAEEVVTEVAVEEVVSICLSHLIDKY